MFPHHFPRTALVTLVATFLAFTLADRVGAAPPPPSPGTYIGGHSGGYHRGDAGVYIGGYSNGYYRGDTGVYVGGYSGGFPAGYTGDRRTGSDYGFKGSSTEFFPGPPEPNRRDPGGYLPPRERPRPAGDTVYLTVQVPAAAEIWFQGTKTTQKGPVRLFESPPLKPGKTYTYTIRARWTDNGRPIEQTREVAVHAGEWTKVDFSAPKK
jgi:uncharacterized protein (TIGR03000 family)